MKNIAIAILLSLVSFEISAQFTISGKVTNEANEPLEFVSVFLPYTDYATYTDANGYYELTDVESDYYDIKFTFVGYRSKEIEIDLLGDMTIDMELSGAIYNIDEIEINAEELEDNQPFAHTTMEKEDLSSRELGQDIPTLLQMSPSLVVSSDAGNGIGYSSIRLRGSDQARLNVTLNGIPLNDAESHQVFWVNMPDLTNSVSSIQVQRGAGSSTNGPGAFGGSVHINTDDFSLNPYAQFSTSGGSFGTLRYNGSLSTGLMNGKYGIDFRYSRIQSDGYMDRATSDLSSYHISIKKITENSFVKFNIFSGREETYQAWNGVPEGIYLNDDDEKRTHFINNQGTIYETAEDSINYFSSDRRYNLYTYENQVDKYNQNHFQLLSGRKINDNVNLNLKLNYTRGKGYYEEYKNQQDLIDYDLPNYQDTSGMFVQVDDLVRRRWLDNHFLYGSVDVEWSPNDKFNLISGTSYSYYDGDHFGRVVNIGGRDMRGALNPYYSNLGKKNDFNIFTKASLVVWTKLQTFLDLQFRRINFSVLGDDNDDVNIDLKRDYQFFNPKFGIVYNPSDSWSLYSSIAVAQKEPVRSDLVDNIEDIESEKMVDIEVGTKVEMSKLSIGLNFYHMAYENQLIPTGELNDVGAALRQNVDDSYRRGIELELDYQIMEDLSYSGSINLSQNKIKNYQYLLYDYIEFPALEIVESFDETDISYSPSVVHNSQLNYKLGDISFHWLTNFVGSQFLDNTSNSSKKLDSYLLNGLNVVYKIKQEIVNDVKVKLLVNNIFDVQYASNGYTYSYYVGELIQENFYFPQAGINFLIGVNVRL